MMAAWNEIDFGFWIKPTRGMVGGLWYLQDWDSDQADGSTALKVVADLVCAIVHKPYSWISLPH